MTLAGNFGPHSVDLLFRLGRIKAAVETGLDDNRSALLEAAKERTPEAQTATIRRLAEPNASSAGPAPPPSAKPLRDLAGISGGEFARWIKITTPNDRPHVIRVLEMAAAILRDELDELGLGSDEMYSYVPIRIIANKSEQ